MPTRKEQLTNLIAGAGLLVQSYTGHPAVDQPPPAPQEISVSAPAQEHGGDTEPGESPGEKNAEEYAEARKQEDEFKQQAEEIGDANRSQENQPTQQPVDLKNGPPGAGGAVPEEGTSKAAKDPNANTHGAATTEANSNTAGGAITDADANTSGQTWTDADTNPYGSGEAAAGEANPYGSGEAAAGEANPYGAGEAAAGESNSYGSTEAAASESNSYSSTEAAAPEPAPEPEPY